MSLFLLPLWLLPLFIAYKAAELGALGVWGRGLPILGSRRRLCGPAGMVIGRFFMACGLAVLTAFGWWLNSLV